MVFDLKRLYQSHPLRQPLQKYVINDISIQSRDCTYVFVFLVVFVYVVDVRVDAADAGIDGVDAVIHVDSMAGAGVGVFGPPAKTC